MFREGFDFDNRFMKQDYVEIENVRYLISTVDLSLNHQFIEGAPPLYYETMIFENEPGTELYCNRYTTEKQAIEGHEQVLEALKNNKFTLNEYGFTFEEEK